MRAAQGVSQKGTGYICRVKETSREFVPDVGGKGKYEDMNRAAVAMHVHAVRNAKHRSVSVHNVVDHISC